MDREDVIERVNWSPRGGVSVAVLPEGRGILRGGVGRFRQRTPLNVGAFGQFESRMVTRFGADGQPLGPAVTFVNVLPPDLRTPEAVAGNIEWNQRFGRRVLFKVNYLKRQGDTRVHRSSRTQPAGKRGSSASGTSRYWELEMTGRYLGGERRDLTVSYVRSSGTADLNNYDQFYGNLRNPIVRPNEHNLIPTDVPNRLVVRGHHRAARSMGHCSRHRDPLGVPVVGGRRVPGLRRPAQSRRPPPGGEHARLLALTSVARLEVPVSCRTQGVQPPRRVGSSRCPIQHRLTGLRPVLQSDRALDWLRVRVGEVTHCPCPTSSQLVSAIVGMKAAIDTLRPFISQPMF